MTISDQLKAIEAYFSENALKEAREAAYTKSIALFNNNSELASMISNLTVLEIRQRMEEGADSFLTWMNEYKRMSDKFFVEGLDGDTSVDAYGAIEVHLIAYETYYNSMNNQIKQFCIENGYSQHNNINEKEETS